MTDIMTHPTRALAASNSHSVIDGFLGPSGAEAARRELVAAYQAGFISDTGALGGGRDGRSEKWQEVELRSDSIGWFDCIQVFF